MVGGWAGGRGRQQLRGRRQGKAATPSTALAKKQNSIKPSTDATAARARNCWRNLRRVGLAWFAQNAPRDSAILNMAIPTHSLPPSHFVVAAWLCDTTAPRQLSRARHTYKRKTASPRCIRRALFAHLPANLTYTSCYPLPRLCAPRSRASRAILHGHLPLLVVS